MELVLGCGRKTDNILSDSLSGEACGFSENAFGSLYMISMDCLVEEGYKKVCLNYCFFFPIDNILYNFN